jgi:hypothetical protein
MVGGAWGKIDARGRDARARSSASVPYPMSLRSRSGPRSLEGRPLSAYPGWRSFNVAGVSASLRVTYGSFWAVYRVCRRFHPASARGRSRAAGSCRCAGFCPRPRWSRLINGLPSPFPDHRILHPERFGVPDDAPGRAAGVIAPMASWARSSTNNNRPTVDNDRASDHCGAASNHHGAIGTRERRWIGARECRLIRTP